MKTIRQFALMAFLTVGAFGAMTLTSCNGDKCDDVDCQNGATCDDGNCICDIGYEGDLCQTESRIKFIKSWSASDQIGSTTIPYTVAIVPGTAVTNVIISNDFSDDFFANTISATVDGNTITIADQKPDGNGDYRVSGSGTYTSNKINWTYKITKISTQDVQNYTGIWQ